ncbi:ferredoxin [Candidatus Poribacteria bacterium]|nr:ferredoxin [Candidatus Poribacteria bacterium]
MILVDYDACDYCGACVGTCPENVIHLLDTRLFVDNEGCTDCSICTYACPVGALELVQTQPRGLRRELRV